MVLGWWIYLKWSYPTEWRVSSSIDLYMGPRESIIKSPKKYRLMDLLKGWCSFSYFSCPFYSQIFCGYPKGSTKSKPHAGRCRFFLGFLMGETSPKYHQASPTQASWARARPPRVPGAQGCVRARPGMRNPGGLQPANFAIYGWTAGWMDRWIDRQMDRQIDR